MATGGGSRAKGSIRAPLKRQGARGWGPAARRRRVGPKHVQLLVPLQNRCEIDSRRAGTLSGPVPDISLRARRAPPTHQDFFVPHDEPNTAGPRRHCGDSRAGGRHLFPIRFGNFWCKEKIGPKRGSGPSGLSRRAGPKFRIRVGHSAADRAGHAPPPSRHWAGRAAGRGSNCCRKMGLIVSH